MPVYNKTEGVSESLQSSVCNLLVRAADGVKATEFENKIGLMVLNNRDVPLTGSKRL